MKKTIVISVVSVIILVAVLIVGIFLSGGDYSRVLAANWKIKLPWEARCSEIYENNTAPSFTGDGIRYHVFSCENAVAVEQMTEWRDDECETAFDMSQTESVKKWMDVLGVPGEWQPDFENCRYYYSRKDDNSEIIILWNRDAEILYVAESFL